MPSKKPSISLNAPERKAVISARKKRYKYREISDYTGVSEGTLCRLHNGKINVQAYIADRILTGCKRLLREKP